MCKSVYSWYYHEEYPSFDRMSFYSRMLTMALDRIPRATMADLIGRTAACLSTLVMEVLDAMIET